MDPNFDRRLKSADPAGPTPAALDAFVNELAARSTSARPRWWVPLLTIGGALALTGGLAAATDLDTYLLSVPPFATVDEGTVRPTAGLPYVSLGETDRGEECALYIDLGGLSSEEFTAVSDYWAAADPVAFATGVENRLNVVPTTEREEWRAIQDQILEDLDGVVHGIAWGTAPPGNPFGPGEPHLGAISRTCTDDLKAMGFNG